MPHSDLEPFDIFFQSGDILPGWRALQRRWRALRSPSRLRRFPGCLETTELSNPIFLPPNEQADQEPALRDLGYLTPPDFRCLDVVLGAQEHELDDSSFRIETWLNGIPSKVFLSPGSSAGEGSRDKSSWSSASLLVDQHCGE